MNGSYAPELTNLLKEITEEIAKYVITEGYPIILIDEYSWYREVLSLMAKQVNLCESCILLLENGMEQEAYLLAKSQFNNAIWVKYLCEAEEGDKSKRINGPEIMDFMNPDRWIDYQRAFDVRYDFGRSVGLADALELCEIEPDGHFYDGLDDAINTAKIIKKLEEDPEYQTVHSDHVIGSESEPLRTNLGELFAGLNIKFA